MPEIDINGVLVKFPFEPYDIQRDYMKSVIQCLELENDGNAILESPTGTGKTLCLLCSTLGWVEKRAREEGRSNAPKVIYASRTHSQISQAMKELKRTEYNHMKTAVVGSRNQLCIHPKLQDKSNTDKIHLCKSYIKEPYLKCGYYPNVLKKMKEPEFQQPILDIEDLVRNGLKHECCPFYVSKEIVKSADIIFMPYNYLIDPRIRQANQIDLAKSIIILDEAHNVEKFCEESACTVITSTDATIAIRDMKYIVQKVDAYSLHRFESNPTETKLLKACFHHLERALSGIRIVGTGTYPGGYVFSLLKQAKITKHNYDWYTKLLDKLIALLVDRKAQKYARVPEGIGLKSILDFLKIAFSTSSDHLRDRVDRCYKVYIENLTENNNNLTTSRLVQDIDGKKVNFWCFSPAFGMQHLVQQGIRSLILTSGTLAPLKPIITEMDIQFPVHLENPHIIQSFQVFPKIVGYGVDDVLLDAAYRNRDNKDFLLSLGKSIVEFAKVVPDGLLVFFPSYPLMYKCENFWRSQRIWGKIEEQKPIFMEPRNKDALKQAMRQYYGNINQQKGAIFMAVLRGKVSEGLDFADMYGRGVIIVGIPYGPCKEKKVILKQEYLNENRTRENEMLSGNQWYCLDAIRAVNQAIGRVIRHRNDYGAILLCDNRYIYNQNENNISSWIRDHLSRQRIGEGGFQETICQLSQFFSMAKNSLPVPEPNFSLENNIDLDDTLQTLQRSELMDDDENMPLIDEGPSDDEPDSQCEFDEDDFAAPQFMLQRRRTRADGNASNTSATETEPQPSTSRGNESNGANSNESGIIPKRSRTDGTSTSDSGVNQKTTNNSLLKYVQNDLGSESYEVLVTAFDLYDNDGNYETFRDSLFQLFREPRVLSLLKCMTFLLVFEHRSRFDEESNEFIRSLPINDN